MAPASSHPVVHLELHTGNLPRACGFYTGLFGWRLEQVRMGSGSYLTLDWGSGIEGGVVEHDTERALWLPYVQVCDIDGDTRRAESRLRGGSGVNEVYGSRRPGRRVGRLRLKRTSPQIRVRSDSRQ
jgi:predicted enzyme related to lactoylglutathione lyase